VLNAIKTGGTGSGRMPPGLLEGEDADAVATYVANVAGR
jgi:mono/diheme cytochrome c family protein